MGNSTRILEELSVRCNKQHEHVELLGGRTKQAEVYHDGLCRAVVIGLKKQMLDDGRIQIGEIGISHAEENVTYEYQEYWDDLSGEKLDSEMVRVARREEVAQLEQHEVYDKVPEEECWNTTGKATNRHALGGRKQGRQSQPGLQV